MAQGIRSIPLGVRVRVQDIMVMVMLLWNYTFTSTLQGFASMLIRFLWSLCAIIIIIIWSQELWTDRRQTCRLGDIDMTSTGTRSELQGYYNNYYYYYFPPNEEQLLLLLYPTWMVIPPAGLLVMWRNALWNWTDYFSSISMVNNFNNWHWQIEFFHGTQQQT